VTLLGHALVQSPDVAPPGQLLRAGKSNMLSLTPRPGELMHAVPGSGPEPIVRKDRMIDPIISFRSLRVAAQPIAAPIPCVRSRIRPSRASERGKSMPSHVRSRLPFTLVAVLATLAVFALGTLAGPPAAEAQRKKVLNIAAKEPDTLDPHTSVLGQSQAIYRFMYRGLTRFAIKDGKVTTAEVEPDLAESWTLSPDGTVYTFKLKKGVQFHKGQGEMTAEDVKYSFERQIK
jgi:hypothetical protein